MSCLSLANSARRRLISICSALTFDRLPAPWSVPCREALTQLNSVCSTIPTLRAAAMLWPDSTSRTASCLNSSVYRARVAFVIFIPSTDSITQLRDTFFAGKVTLLLAYGLEWARRTTLLPVLIIGIVTVLHQYSFCNRHWVQESLLLKLQGRSSIPSGA
jgi:hypothetical protein